MNLDLASDVVEPSLEDWTTKPLSEVFHAAAAGIHEAERELARRDL